MCSRLLMHVQWASAWGKMNGSKTGKIKVEITMTQVSVYFLKALGPCPHLSLSEVQHLTSEERQVSRWMATTDLCGAHTNNIFKHVLSIVFLHIVFVRTGIYWLQGILHFWQCCFCVFKWILCYQRSCLIYFHIESSQKIERLP